MSAEQQPVLWTFGGPNGSGKSFITNNFHASDPDIQNNYINADVIAKERNISNLEAANIAQTQREAALLARKSFAMETALSMPDKIDIRYRAKSLGYEVRLVFVSTQDPNINVRRVRQRYQDSGHNVPTEKIFSRYERSMRYLPQAVNIADKAYIFNNSFKNPVLIAEKTKEKGIIIYEQDQPSKWTRENIITLLGITREDEQHRRYYVPRDRKWEYSDDRDR